MKRGGTCGVLAHAPQARFGTSVSTARAVRPTRSQEGRKLDAAQSATITAAASDANAIRRTGMTFSNSGLLTRWLYGSVITCLPWIVR